MTKKHAIYYLDEFSIFAVVILSVLMSEAVEKMVKGHPIANLGFDWVRVVPSFLVAVMVYGGIHTKWAPNDLSKPSWPKRASTAVAQGIAWRSIIGWASGEGV